LSPFCGRAPRAGTPINRSHRRERGSICLTLEGSDALSSPNCVIGLFFSVLPATSKVGEGSERIMSKLPLDQVGRIERWCRRINFATYFNSPKSFGTLLGLSLERTAELRREPQNVSRVISHQRSQ
jgi:hypothetical protein